MATIQYFWHGFIHRGTTFMYLQYSRSPLFITFCQMFGRRRTPSARPSLLMFCIDRSIARINSSLVLYRVPRSGSFTLVKRSYSHGLKTKRRHLVLQNRIILYDNARSHITAAVTDLLRRWKWEILEHPPYSPDMSPCDYDLFTKVKKPLRRAPVQHKISTYPCYRAVNTEHQQRLTSWWYTMPSKHLENVINKGVDYIEGT